MEQRGIRYSDIISEDILKKQHAVIIGCGAIGRQIGTMIASMGFGIASLIDFDKIEDVNLGTQGWFESEVGQLKVDALADTMMKLNSSMTIYKYSQRFDINIYKEILKENPTIIFIGIDSLPERHLFYKRIFSRIKTHFVPIIDGRMSAEVLRIVSSLEYSDIEYAAFTSEGEGDRERCTYKSTFYCASMAASFMIDNYLKHLRKIPVRKDLQYLFQIYANVDSNEYQQFERRKNESEKGKTIT